MPNTSDSIPATATKIEINLSRLAQLFNSLDPSPFHERDLDHDAEDYIVGSAEEASRHYPLALVIHLPADQLPAQGLLRELAFPFGNERASDIFGEGMLIIGWVAMWRPLEIFLYEWVPIRRRCRILAKLAEMPVIVQSKRIG